MNWDGLVLINKPPGLTSHTVVQHIKTRLDASKAGHLGTLDPIATGVFPVCLGKATRLAPFFMAADKCYLATIRFGFFTTTDDREGEQEGPFRKFNFSMDRLAETVAGFLGEYNQKPPAFSAKKIKGRKAYEIARSGQKPELPVQKVKIYDIRLINFERDQAMIYVHCGSGTYIRSLAREIGERLACGAHVQDLVRSKFNEFTLDQCCDPEAPLQKMKASHIPLDKMLLQYPEVVVDESTAKKISSGSAISQSGVAGKEWARIFDQEKRLLAIAKVEGEDESRLLPKIVFA